MRPSNYFSMMQMLLMKARKCNDFRKKTEEPVFNICKLFFRFIKVVHLDKVTRSERVSPSVRQSRNDHLYPLNGLPCFPLAINWCLSRFNGLQSHGCHSAVTSVLQTISNTERRKKENISYSFNMTGWSSPSWRARPQNISFSIIQLGITSSFYDEKI